MGVVPSVTELSAGSLQVTETDRWRAPVHLRGSLKGTGITRLSPCAVLVVPPDMPSGGAARFDRVLVPVDFSEDSKRALEQAATLCAQLESSLIVQHVVEEVPHPAYYLSEQNALLAAFPDLRERVRTALQEWTSDLPGVHSDVMISEGRAHQAIVRTAREHDVDLIVMGSHGAGAAERFLVGSATDRVVRRAHCPVLVYPALPKQDTRLSE